VGTLLLFWWPLFTGAPLVVSIDINPIRISVAAWKHSPTQKSAGSWPTLFQMF
jgi:hypothetical protein